MGVQVSVLGLGWLGLPLSRLLINKDYKIKGSTTSDDKLQSLTNEGYSAYKVLLEEEGVTGAIENCLEGSDILILNTPPGLRRNPSSNYVAKIKKLIPFIEASSVSKVLFIGSTAVFKEGADFPVIKNDTKPNSISNSGLQLQEVESLLTNNSNFETTILRFAGLVNDQRHPARMMSKRVAIPNPKAPINLIHREDCVGIIDAILEQKKWGQIINAAYPLHVAKDDYYTKVCKQKGYSNPDFSYENDSSGKIIDGNEVWNMLNYVYKHSVLKEE